MNLNQDIPNNNPQSNVESPETMTIQALRKQARRAIVESSRIETKSKDKDPMKAL